MMCKVFKVSRASYYKWLRSGPSARWQENEKLLVEIMKGAEYLSISKKELKQKNTDCHGLSNGYPGRVRAVRSF